MKLLSGRAKQHIGTAQMKRLYFCTPYSEGAIKGGADRSGHDQLHGAEAGSPAFFVSVANTLADVARVKISGV